MMSEGFIWNDMGCQRYEEQVKERQVKSLIKKAQGLGLSVGASQGAGEINTEIALA
jgi:hypothetical protein